MDKGVWTFGLQFVVMRCKGLRQPSVSRPGGNLELTYTARRALDFLSRKRIILALAAYWAILSVVHCRCCARDRTRIELAVTAKIHVHITYDP